MRTNSDGKPIPVCPRCIKKSDSARRALAQFKEKRRVLDIMGSCFEDLEIYEGIEDNGHSVAFLKKNLSMFPKIAEAWRTGGLSAAIGAGSKINAEYSEQVRILRDRILSNIGHCTDAKEYKEPLDGILAGDADNLRERLALKKETNPAKRSAVKRRRQKWEGSKKRREKERERERNSKGPKEISLGRSIAGDEAADAVYPSDEKG